MQIKTKFMNSVALAKLIGWEPRPWHRRSRGGMLNGNGRRKPRGAWKLKPSRNPADVRRKARSLAGRKH